MYCPDCQKVVATQPNAHSATVHHCVHCRQLVLAAVPSAAGDTGTNRATLLSPLADDFGRQWRIDTDLSASEQFVRAWRKRDSISTRELESRLHRVDPPDTLIAQSTEPGEIKRPDPTSARADSIASIVMVELMAIAALMILLFIEAQHSPHFFKFAIVALTGAGAVLLITMLRLRAEPVCEVPSDRETQMDRETATRVPSRRERRSATGAPVPY